MTLENYILTVFAFLKLGRMAVRETVVLYSIAAPVTWLNSPDGRQRILREGISYEHQYDSRLDPNYPPRGKVLLK